MSEKSTSLSANPRANPRANLSACGHLVRQHDSDHFFSALLLPASQRERAFTLLAFNQEIARVRSVVSEPILGQMRLQWWREAIEAVQAGKPAPAHETAAPLGALLKDEPQLAPLLLELLEARERDLDDAPFTGIEELEAYARASSAPLLQAIGENNPDIATGYALVGILRAVPAELKAGRCRLAEPHDVAALEAMVREVAERAAVLLGSPARGQAKLWRILARAYLKILRQSGYNVADERFQRPYTWRGLALLWASLTG